MRVIAGKAKGHRLKSLKSDLLRPTSDLMRGAIFSALETLKIDWSRVIDFYAGTGALGIEALSRGAEWADFVEKDSRICSVIKENLKHTRFTDQTHIYCCSVKKAISFINKQYKLIFMDPPYAESDIPYILEKLTSSPIVGDDSTIVIEHTNRHHLDSSYGHLHLKKNLKHGDTRVSIYQSLVGGLS